MSRKTIISDFSALKGKVSFSEETSDAKMPMKVIPSTAQKPKEPDKGLKIGICLRINDSRGDRKLHHCP